MLNIPPQETNALDSYTHHTGERSVRRGLRTLKEVVWVFWHALDKNFFNNIVGPVPTWFHPTDKNTEWDMMVRWCHHPSQWWRLAKLLVEDLVSIIIVPIGFLLMARSTLITRNALEGGQYAQLSLQHEEDWWYVNGIGVNSDLQRENAKHMSRMFSRQIRMFYNPTQGLLFDTFMCMTGLAGHKTHAGKRLLKTLMREFQKNPTKKIIIIAHSGGCIVTTNVIRHLINTGYMAAVSQLEIYTFGSPVTSFPSAWSPALNRFVPFYEHYANTGDFVCKIGVLRLEYADWKITGKVYIANVDGHFLGDHYLAHLAKGVYRWQDGSTSELYKRLQTGNATPSIFHL